LRFGDGVLETETRRHSGWMSSKSEGGRLLVVLRLPLLLVRRVVGVIVPVRDPGAGAFVRCSSLEDGGWRGTEWDLCRPRGRRGRERQRDRTLRFVRRRRRRRDVLPPRHIRHGSGVPMPADVERRWWRDQDCRHKSILILRRGRRGGRLPLLSSVSGPVPVPAPLLPPSSPRGTVAPSLVPLLPPVNMGLLAHDPGIVRSSGAAAVSILVLALVLRVR
jgi:hypothetical protein